MTALDQQAFVDALAAAWDDLENDATRWLVGAGWMR